MKELTKKQKNMLARILWCIVIFVSITFLVRNPIVKFSFAVLAYIIIGWDVLYRAIRNLGNGRIFDENFLMSLATIVAFSIGEYSEGVFVMLFYQVGEFFQSYAVGYSRSSIANLMDLRPDFATVEQNGVLMEVDPEEIELGEIIVVRTGEKIALDGVLLNESGVLNTSALTGESMPRTVVKGDTVFSGSINEGELLRIQTTCEYEDSTVARILELVENATEKKAKAENFITKFARWYTPLVVIGAVLVALIPSLLFGDWATWVHRALIFLVVSCPCALVISVPLSFFGGIGGASRQGILVKGGNYFEVLAKIHTVVLDKTGTITKGTFEVQEIQPQNVTKEELLEMAALVESYSTHPIARSILQAYGKECDQTRVQDVKEVSGRGISAMVDGELVLAGNAKFLQEQGVELAQIQQGTVVYLAKKGQYAGCIQIDDTIKPNAQKAFDALHKAGVKEIIMLTGDHESAAKKIAQQVGIDRVYAELLPDGKVESVEELLQKKPKYGTLAFVGDGINDAPVLSRADVGIAMGAIGSDAAIEAADVVIMDDDLNKIASAISISKKTLGIAYQNIVFALGIKAIVLFLGTLGLASMWQAIFADVGVSVLAILNAMRALRHPKL